MDLIVAGPKSYLSDTNSKCDIIKQEEIPSNCLLSYEYQKALDVYGMNLNCVDNDIKFRVTKGKLWSGATWENGIKGTIFLSKIVLSKLN